MNLLRLICNNKARLSYGPRNLTTHSDLRLLSPNPIFN
ncbi:hypothetical protein F383_25903 [Gossypium arboreum]|uniref:Uncharacterized protein n=1 Tax=Gossypium arboreum TaxID=29729 RepID=A0A0B0MR81_GOSAR|nr:hypothetical protein F383_25903 [Gossypium arboreum]